MTQAASAPTRPEDYPITLRDASLNALIGLNDHRDTAGALLFSGAPPAAYVVTRLDFSQLEFRDQRDGLHLLYGGDLGVVSSEFRFVSLQGMIVETSPALLEDRIAKLMSAFQPETMVARSVATRGVLPLDFYCPTNEAGYSPLVHEVFFGRSTGIPAVFDRKGNGLGAIFALQLICPDTRRYLYTPESKVANTGNSYSIALPNWTAAQGADVAPVVTLVLTAAGGATTTIRYVDTLLGTTTDMQLKLDTIGGGAHTVVVDMATYKITLDGARRDDLRISAVNTFWRIGAGGGTLSVPNTGGGRTNLTSATAVYRQARA